MNKIVTRGEYDSCSPELRALLDEMRIHYAVGLLKEMQESGITDNTIEEVVESVVTLHQTGYITLVYKEGDNDSTRFVASLPCDDGVHTEVCETADEIVQSCGEVAARWGKDVT